jgi:hypothetical protein
MKLEPGKFYVCRLPNIKYIKAIEYVNSDKLCRCKLYWRTGEFPSDVFYNLDGSVYSAINCTEEVRITGEYNLNAVEDCNHRDENRKFMWVNCGFGTNIVWACKKCGTLKKDYYKELRLEHLCDCD